MKLDYFTLLSDEPIWLPKIGTLIPPKLRQIKRQIGFSNYNMFLVLLNLTPETYYMKIKKDVEYWNSLTKKEKNNLTIYGMIKKEQGLLMHYIALFSFFFKEDIRYKDGLFLMLNPTMEHAPDINTQNIKQGELIGIVSEDNFRTVMSLIKQLCFMDDGFGNEDEKKLKFKNAKAKRMYERMKNSPQPKTIKEEKTRSIPNMISSIPTKLHIDIDRVWNWTIFQLYDQYTRIEYCAQQNRLARSVSIWGDKERKYDPSIWCTNYYEK